MTGIEMIERERVRQANIEGFDFAHDDKHDTGQLAIAAAAYAAPDDVRHDSSILEWWPFANSWWKPATDDSTEGRVRELAKAGALIAAEIDRIHRAQK